MEAFPSRLAGTPVVAIESARTLPTSRAVFQYAKIMHVVEGRVRVETPSGAVELQAGSSLTLGAGVWCKVRPLPAVRAWTLYVDERFLRDQIAWLLPDKSRMLPGVHPQEWDGSAVVLEPGMTLFRQVEPLWRQISVVTDSRLAPELVVARAVTLFVHAVELAVPTLLDPHTPNADLRLRASPPVLGRLTPRAATGQLSHAAYLLRTQMAEPWTVSRLATEVALSRAHLTRLFTMHVGLAPMRYLMETRLTEFTRLVEETDLPISAAAMEVGWRDSRIAAIWFRKRYGVSPSQFRGHPHPWCEFPARG